MKFKYRKFLNGEGSSSDSIRSPSRRSIGSLASSSTSSSECSDADPLEEDSNLSEDETNNNNRHGQSWCQLAYWEECQRVGHLIPVSSSSIEIFSALPKSKDGLCLKSLFKENKRPSESTTRTREKIGQGILLSHSDAEGLWVYNRTQSPIFVNSPTLEPPPNILQNNSGASDRITTSSSSTTDSNNYPFTVIKVLPGYSIQIFDYQKSALYEQIRPAFHGPFDPYSVRISFAKGWGGKYSRQVVTNCPCWLEVLLMTPTR